MKARRITALALLAAALVAGSANSATAATSADMERAVTQALADKGLGASDAPGCAVSVTGRDGLRFARGYGGAHLEQATPFALDTVSETGSVAKQFTAAEILLLAADGKLSLDDDIRRYLPEMPDYGAPIRIYDLLHQTSGVREWATLAALRGYPRFYRKIYGMPDLLRLVAGQRSLNFTPGERYEYSNSNYGLLAIIVERVSGRSAQAFAAERIFGPLGMKDTQWRDDLRRIVPRRAAAYRRTASGYELAMPTEDVFGHGALLTTVGDLQIWNDAILQGRLSPYVTREMLTPGRLRNGETRAYGGGVVLADYRGHRLVRHGGVTAGYTAQLWGFPDDGLSIAMLCNIQVGDMGEIAARAADAALGLPAPTPPVAAAPKAAARLKPGYYGSASGEMIAIARDGHATTADLFNRKGPSVLVANGTGGFTTGETPGLELRVVAPDELAAALDGHDPTRFRILDPTSPTASPEGTFASADLAAAFTARREGASYRMELDDRLADDPIWFELQWLTGDSYLARLHTKSGYIRDDFVAQVSPAGLALSAVMGLQGVDNLTFRRVAPPAGH